MKRKIAGVVVLYRPDAEVESNIRSYLSELDALYAIDNSEEPDKVFAARLSKLPKVEYVPAGGNKGIAWALNRGAERAAAEGAQFLLTMDQDSKASESMVGKLLEGFDRPGAEETGIVSPFHVRMDTDKPSESKDFVEELVVMTSGNVVRLDAYKAAGGFDENLFIDGVDQDFCLKLRLHGFKVVIAKHVPLYHKLGNETQVKALNRNLRVTHHSAVRRYYITRNRLYLNSIYRKEFPEFCRHERKQNLKEFVKILISEKDKILKLKMIAKGRRDFRRKRFGKIEL